MTSERVVTDALDTLSDKVAALSERFVGLSTIVDLGFKRMDDNFASVRAQAHDDSLLIGRHDGRLDSLESTRDIEAGAREATGAMRRWDIARITIGLGLVNCLFGIIVFVGSHAGWW